MRQSSAFALFKIGALDGATKHQALSVVIESLKPARGGDARQQAAYLLGELRAEAKAAVPALKIGRAHV